jgi:hypothetical protein
MNSLLNHSLSLNSSPNFHSFNHATNSASSSALSSSSVGANNVRSTVQLVNLMAKNDISTLILKWENKSHNLSKYNIPTEFIEKGINLPHLALSLQPITSTVSINPFAQLPNVTIACDSQPLIKPSSNPGSNVPSPLLAVSDVIKDKMKKREEEKAKEMLPLTLPAAVQPNNDIMKTVAKLEIVKSELPSQIPLLVAGENNFSSSSNSHSNTSSTISALPALEMDTAEEASTTGSEADDDIVSTTEDEEDDEGQCSDDEGASVNDLHHIISTSSSLMEVNAAIRTNQPNNKGTSCHQCKNTKTLNKLIFCANSFNKRGDKRLCRKKYCNACLMKFYNEDINELDIRTWVCASCRDICCCAACTRRYMRQQENKINVLTQALTVDNQQLQRKKEEKEQSFVNKLLKDIKSTENKLQKEKKLEAKHGLEESSGEAPRVAKKQKSWTAQHYYSSVSNPHSALVGAQVPSAAIADANPSNATAAARVISAQLTASNYPSPYNTSSQQPGYNQQYAQHPAYAKHNNMGKSIGMAAAPGTQHSFAVSGAQMNPMSDSNLASQGILTNPPTHPASTSLAPSMPLVNPSTVLQPYPSGSMIAPPANVSPIVSSNSPAMQQYLYNQYQQQQMQSMALHQQQQQAAAAANAMQQAQIQLQNQIKALQMAQQQQQNAIMHAQMQAQALQHQQYAAAMAAQQSMNAVMNPALLNPAMNPAMMNAASGMVPPAVPMTNCSPIMAQPPMNHILGATGSIYSPQMQQSRQMKNYLPVKPSSPSAPAANTTARNPMATPPLPHISSHASAVVATNDSASAANNNNYNYNHAL